MLECKKSLNFHSPDVMLYNKEHNGCQDSSTEKAVLPKSFIKEKKKSEAGVSWRIFRVRFNKCDEKYRD